MLLECLCVFFLIISYQKEKKKQHGSLVQYPWVFIDSDSTKETDVRLKVMDETLPNSVLLLNWK